MKIAFFGTGLMGRPMALRLMEAGYELTVFNRTRSKTDILKARGARVALNPLQAAESSDTIITMLTDYSAIRDTLLNESSLDFQGKSIIQMGTISCEQSIQLQEDFHNRRASYMEAPVLGSIPQVKAGSLIILFGGTQSQLAQWDTLLGHFGEKLFWLGPVGQAMAVKLALNQLIAILTTGFAMSLGFLVNKKVNIDQFMDILRNSSLYAPTFDKKGTRMLDGHFDQPNFPVQHLLKDLELIIKEFSGQQITVEPLNEVALLLKKAIEQGYTDLDYSVLYNVVNPK